MCIAFFCFGSEPPHPLLTLAFNRDEYFQRPTQPLHHWEDGSGLLAGRDLEGGGTWLGVNARRGRVAFLTNLRSRDPIAPSTHEQKQHASRGELPTGFLNGDASPQDYAQALRPNHYHGYNLVLGDLRSDPRVGAFVYTNNGATAANQNCAAATSAHTNGQNGSGHLQEGRQGPQTDGALSGQEPGGQRLASPAGEVQLLQPGRVYGLSNGLLMQWPKVTSGVAVLEDLLPSITEDSVPWDRIFDELLGDTRRLVPPPGPDARAAASAATESGPPGTADPRVTGGPEEAPATAPDPADEGHSTGSGASPARVRIPPSEMELLDGALALVSAPAVGEVGKAVQVPNGRSPGSVTAFSASAACGGGDGPPVPSAAGGAAASVAAASTAAHSVGDAVAAATAVGAQKPDLTVFARHLAHITSGRFVEAVESPFGLYGTRCQTVIVVRHDGSAEARERHRHPDGVWREEVVTFQLART